MRWTALLVLVLSLQVGAPGALWAGGAGKSAEKKRDEGTLARFEKEATRSKDDRDYEDHEDRDHDKGRGRHHDDGCDDDDDDDDYEFAAAFLCELGRATYFTTFYGGIGSWVRMEGSPSGQWERSFPRRRAGEPLIPVLSVGGQAQDTGGDVSASEVRAEAGYGPFGFEVRKIRYRERYPADALSITRAHFLYRMSFSRSVEIDMGTGYATLSGNRSTTGFSLTTPVRVYPVSSFGLELRPSWAWMGGDTITDCSLLAVARRSVVSLTAGYRWASAGHVDLDGPVIGLALNF